MLSTRPPTPPPLPPPQTTTATMTTTKPMPSNHRLEHNIGEQLRHSSTMPEMQMRTIFSCMWPSCTKNCDSLEDIERHVRSHLGPKHYDSIGDEDFYYEETEVDEPTYLAIFSSPQAQPGAALRNNYQHTDHHNHNHSHHLQAEPNAAGQRHHHCRHHDNHNHNHHQALPLSPSHNSDGLSSGHSFASSSPATSPVCSTDSSALSTSSSSCSSSSSSSSSLSYHHHHQNLATAASSAASSASDQLFAGANSIDWSHFLAASTSATGTPTAKEPKLSEAQGLGLGLSLNQLGLGQQQTRQAVHYATIRNQQAPSGALTFDLDSILVQHAHRRQLKVASSPKSPLANRRQAAGRRATGSNAKRTAAGSSAISKSEQLRASIVEQLNQNLTKIRAKSTGARRMNQSYGQQAGYDANSVSSRNLQFSMQLTGSSPHEPPLAKPTPGSGYSLAQSSGSASSSGALYGQRMHSAQFDHSYEAARSIGSGASTLVNSDGQQKAAASPCNTFSQLSGRAGGKGRTSASASRAGTTATTGLVRRGKRAGMTPGSRTNESTGNRARGGQQGKQIFQSSGNTTTSNSNNRSKYSNGRSGKDEKIAPAARQNGEQQRRNSNSSPAQLRLATHGQSPAPPALTPSGDLIVDETPSGSSVSSSPPLVSPAPLDGIGAGSFDASGQQRHANMLLTADQSLAGGIGKRARGENRKCRKVYGMDRRDQWCTQCKWKKACSRFCDLQ